MTVKHSPIEHLRLDVGLRECFAYWLEESKDLQLEDIYGWNTGEQIQLYTEFCLATGLVNSFP